MPFDAEQVGRYYDDNTTLFLGLGHGSDGALHRAVWGPGVTRRQQALSYVDRLVSDRAQRIGAGLGRAPHVVDLGSGVGASLSLIARHTPIRGTGVTISLAQATLATRRFQSQGIAGSVRSIQADYCHLPEDLEQADLAFAIESFVHAASAAEFFRQASRLVRQGGCLIVCDDFVADDRLRGEDPAPRWLERVRKGWLASSLRPRADAIELARSVGFVHEETIDLSRHLEIGRPRDRAVALLMRGLGWLPVAGSYWSMLRGGHALQVCLKRGWIKYLFVVWKRE